MKLTREEVQSLLNRIIDEGEIYPAGLYDAVVEMLARAVKALPSREAVERDREKRKRREP